MRNARAVVMIFSTTCTFGQVICHFAVMFALPRMEPQGGTAMQDATLPAIEPAVLEDVFVTDVLTPEVYPDYVRVRLVCERCGERQVVVSLVSTYPASMKMFALVTKALVKAFARWN